MFRPTLTIYLDIRKKLLSGRFPVKVRVTFLVGKKWKMKYYSTGQELSKEQWEKVKDISVRGDLRLVRNKIMVVHAKAALILEKTPHITMDSFDVAMKGEKINRDDFLSFALNELELQRGMIKPKTWTGYENRLKALQKWREIIPFYTIDYNLLQDLKSYLLTEKKRQLNGCYQDFATIKKFYRIAVARGLAIGNPFENFSLAKEETSKAWLTKEELLQLTNLLLTDKITDAEKNTLRHFLFSCFTGLRFGDKITFNQEDITDGRIHLRTAKRGKYITVPFNEQARQLLPFVLLRKLKQSNSRVNTDLVKCMKEAEIKKDITYHSSRHTFAINCLLLGIDLITVRDWLGHKSVTTTEIYAKIAAQYKDESMTRFNDFFETKKASP